MYDRYIPPESRRSNGGEDSAAAVLVVDDDADFRNALSRLLGVIGHPVLQAETGAEAIALARRETPALVLLDVHLPDISGYEVCRELRETFGEQLPILFISGARTEPYDRVSGLLLGADDYVTKPFAQDELLARVRRLLARASLSNSARRFDLTPRELEVLAHLAVGEDQATIAEELVISEKTIATHIQRILPKLGVHSRAEAVAFAHQHGIIPRSE
jgi:DNA-binding NarL/FixJ family response regulator